MKVHGGDKYIFLLMGYKLAQANGGSVEVGEDNGFKGGYKYYRRFEVREYNGQILLTETKTSRNFAHFSRTFEVIQGSKTDIKPYIQDYINESGENCGTTWIH